MNTEQSSVGVDEVAGGNNNGVLHSLLSNLPGSGSSAENLKTWLQGLSFGKLCLLEIALGDVKRDRRERVLNAIDKQFRGEPVLPLSWDGTIDELVAGLEEKLTAAGIDVYA